MSALKLAGEIRAKKLSVTEAVEKYIDMAEKSKLNAFLTVPREQALARAKKVEAQIQAQINSANSANPDKIISPLAGVPIAIKDNFSTMGIETTCASKMLKGYIPVFNAAVVDKLEEAGMIVVGKLNMDEFAMGGSSGSSITSHFGQVLNPWDTSRVAGGSSGGSAAAVANREIPLSLASDTGGSIRLPCSFCGVTGIKPTYGSVSRYGVVAYASSMDQVGVIGVDIDDCAAMLELISGPDPRDSTSVIEKPFCFTKDGGHGGKIGLPRNFMDSGLKEDVKKAIMAAVVEFESAGYQVEEFDMPYMEYIVPVFYILASAEASSNLSRFDGLKYGYRAQAETLSDVYRLSRSEGFGSEVKRRILLGSFVLSSGFYDDYYKKALQARTLIKNAYRKIFESYDMIISPSAHTTADKANEAGGINDDPMKMYMSDIYTAWVNLAGLPAVALPCGFDRDGLPIGLQLIGDSFTEEKLIGAARVYQSRTDFHLQQPGGAVL